MDFANQILGGTLIGIGSAIPLLMEGRIAGISGYASSSTRLKTRDGRTGLMFVLGIILGGIIWYSFSDHQAPLTQEIEPRLWLWPLAEIAVGFGARLAGGCTSGHGVCGLGRVSPRSIVSVLVFMSVAMVVQFFLQRIL